jgi:hypothetical protein
VRSQAAQAWMDKRLAPAERAGLLLEQLSLDEKMAQISCYFPTDISETSEFSERFPYGIGEVSSLEARSALMLDEVWHFSGKFRRRRWQVPATASLQTRMMIVASQRRRSIAAALQTTAFNIGIGALTTLSS